jgi:hypothetical protein
LVCNGAGQASPVSDAPKPLLITYAELQFISGEAKEKRLITTGGADTFNINGIAANFAFRGAVVPSSYNITVTPTPGYFTQTSVAYAGTAAKNLEKIALQKGIALFFNG